MRIYVASSWRNAQYPEVVQMLRELGHEVYDFRNPNVSRGSFRWSDLGPDWQTWSPEVAREALRHPIAQGGFSSDMTALLRSDAVVLVLPCGRSAHLELGWAIGAGKRGYALVPDGVSLEPELMYAMLDAVLVGMDELRAAFKPRSGAAIARAQ